MSSYRDQLEAWISQIDVVADSVIDIGGSANPAKGRTRSWSVVDYIVADNGAEQKFTKDGWFTPTIRLDIQRKIPTDRKYDVVFCLEVMEYIFDPMKAMCNISNLTKEGGIAYVSFPAIYPVHNPQELDALRYTRVGIDKLMAGAGFKSWIITPRVATKGRDLLSEFYKVEGMHPVRGDDVIFDIGYCVEARK